MPIKKRTFTFLALLVLLASLGLSGCAHQSGSEAGALLSQDFRKMDNDELLLYYYRLSEEIDRTERSGSGSAISIGIGGGSWGWGGSGVGVGVSTTTPVGGAAAPTISKPPGRGPRGDATPEHEAALRSGYRARVKGQGMRRREDRSAFVPLLCYLLYPEPWPLNPAALAAGTLLAQLR